MALGAGMLLCAIETCADAPGQSAGGMPIGGMVWRVGDTVDLWDQIDWFRGQGFDGVAFHASPGVAGEWQGFDVRGATARDRGRLKAAVRGFREVSIHAEFPTAEFTLTNPDEPARRAAVERLRPTLALAAEIGANVVTVHDGAEFAEAPDDLRRAALAASVRDLGVMADEFGVWVGFELVRDYDLVLAVDGPVGVTLDTGHVSFGEGAGYAEFGSIRSLVSHLGAKLIHVHVHDYDGKTDHLAIGAGNIDFGELIAALKTTGYSGMLCLELNPDRTAPEDYPMSRELLLRLAAQGA